MERLTRIIIIMLLSKLNPCVAQSSLETDTTVFYVYNSYEDIALDSASSMDLSIELKKSGENYIQVDRFVEADGDRFNDIFDIYGFNYNGEAYFHLHYLRGIGKEKRFIRIQVKGKHCAFILDESIPAYFVPPTVYEGLVTNSLIGYTAFTVGHNNKRWTKEDGSRAFIYYFDSTINKRAKVLDRNLLLKLCIGLPELTERVKNNDILAEEVLDILEQLNAGSGHF